MTLTLSAAEQRALASCSDLMLRPLDFPSLDEWRAAVLRSFYALIDVDVAFFNVRSPPTGSRVSFSPEFTSGVLDRYERLCVNDAGYERAADMRLSAFNQTMLVAGNQEEYRTDPAVCGFYLPNQLLDSIGLLAQEPSSGLGASIELHATRYGSAAFGARGVAILELLLPSFRAGLRAVEGGHAAKGQMAGLLDASGGAFLAVDGSGRRVHQTAGVDTLLGPDPQGDAVRARMLDVARASRSAATEVESGRGALPLLCAAEIHTASARYHVEATRVSQFLGYGRVTLVSVERLAAPPPTDQLLQARHGLSRRELSIARRIADGSSAKGIAGALGISIHTVKRHSERIFAKLRVHSRRAVASALRG
jgi:DNA-binding CsgD family transcriptional regulator